MDLNFFESIKLLLLKIKCRYLFRYRKRGLSLFKDLKAEIPGYNPKVIFDVGANIGQSCAEYAKTFPNTNIYSFELNAGTFEQLKKNAAKYKNVHCINVGLSSSNSVLNLCVDGSSDRHHIVDNEHSNTIQVNVKRLDDVCNEQGISKIDFLKIDTEGHDYNVLLGGESLLDSMSIDIIQVECSMSPLNKDHVPFENFKTFLESKGYYLYNLYEPTSNWPTGQLFLRRSNAVFMSTNFIADTVVPTPWVLKKGLESKSTKSQ